MKPRVPLRQALSDPALLGNVLAGDSWKPWRTLLTAALGEALTDDERALFKQLTGGREREPGERVEELVGVVGRRGGKSRGMATLATYLAGLVDYSDVLAPGERGILLCIAPDQRQAAITRDYAEAAFDQSPVLRQLITNRTQDSLELGDIAIEVRAASFRRLRGPTYIGAICDEGAFFAVEDSVNPDSEIIGAVRPGLATTNGLLAIISSPYARKGELWEAYNKHFGAKGDPRILVAQGSSRTFNPALSEATVARAYERDPVAAAAEYGASFRVDVESYISREALDAVISRGIFERRPQYATAYLGFCDPSGGGGGDSMTLAIGHMWAAKETAVLDCVREIRPPFSPEAAAQEFAATLKMYRLTSVIGDKFGGLWPAEQFARFGVHYDASAEPKSALYNAALAGINSRRVDLLDSPRLVSQLLSLERRTSRTGRGDVIDHPPTANSHDDVSNAAAGCLATILAKGTYNISTLANTAPEDKLGIEGWRQMRLQAYIQSGGEVKLW